MSAAIKRLGRDDWTTLKRLRLHALSDSPAAFLGDPADEAIQPADYWRAKCSEEMWFTAELNGQSAGIARLNPEGAPNECMHIESMWVDPEFRRTGVARALVAALEREAALLGETQLALWVFEANRLARDLYVSLGYKGPRRKQSLRTTEGVLIEEEYLKPLAPQDGD